METEPNTENVHYLDEYPELAKRVWLRRLAKERTGVIAVKQAGVTEILPFNKPPDGAA